MHARPWILLLLTAAVCGCGPAVDLTKGLQVLDPTSGWVDAGIVDGQNKLVPSISFKLKNVSDQTLKALDLNAVFKRVNEQDEWDSSGLRNPGGSGGFAAAATTDLLTINSNQGYKSPEPRLDMLKNSHFVDAKVELFAKYANTQWVRLGDYPIARQLIVR